MGILKSYARTGDGATIVVHAQSLPRPAGGDSICVDGACLTVESSAGGEIAFSLSRETLSKTRFASMARGTRVNLERALRAEQALGGHFVTGHVDALTTVRRVEARRDSTDVVFSIPRGYSAMLVDKGSVAINGVSLTVASLERHGFRVALVPFTLKATNLSGLKSGDRVHFEADILGKYVARYLEARAGA